MLPLLSVPQTLDTCRSPGGSGRTVFPKPLPWIHLLLNLRPIFQFQTYDKVVGGSLEGPHVSPLTPVSTPMTGGRGWA